MLALVEVAESAYYDGKMLEDISIGGRLPVKCSADNKSLVDALRSLKKVDNKYLRINITSLKERIQKGEISSVEWIDTRKQLANCLTKKGASLITLLKAITRL